MSKNVFALVLGVALSFVGRSAEAFFDTPYVTPEHPVTGETISVNVRGGQCDALMGAIPPQITQDGSSIRILFWSVHYTDSELCFLGVGTATLPVGSYSAGNYTLQVDRFYGNILGETIYETLGVIPFTVTGGASSPVPASTLNKPALGLLTLGFLAFAFWSLRSRRSNLLLVALCALPFSTHAQNAPRNRVIELLLTTAPGAPTSEEVVAYYEHPNGPPPIEGLKAESPKWAEHLLSKRAEGDFLAHLQQHPESVRARLERYLVVVYPDDADLADALAALRADPYVASASEPVAMQPSSVDLSQFSVGSTMPAIGGDYGRIALNIDAAWQVAGGYALVANIDTGLDIDGVAFRQFSGGQFVGGNFVEVASYNVSGLGTAPQIPNGSTVDEREPRTISSALCSPNGPSSIAPINAGHGTHTAGLIAAHGADDGVQGTCKHCGISAWKVAYADCNYQTGNVELTWNPTAAAAALAYVGDAGVQVANLSYGDASIQVANYCSNPPPDTPNSATCDAIAHNTYRGVALVAASGNNRTFIQFPANDDRVIAVGGFQQDLSLWDESPGSTTNCPHASFLPPNLGLECGSSYGLTVNSPQQELIASAKAVRSTTYPGVNWVAELGCGDGFPGPGWGNGVGLCTGTSMSSPQVAGIVGLLKSINALVPVGGFPSTTMPTLRRVLATTTAQAQAQQPWEHHVGFGRPDAAAAARKMLGKVANVTIRNRVTPLFRLYSVGNKDFADTTSPQVAVAMMINQKFAYQPHAGAATVPGYSEFPHDPADGALAAPRAAAYVLTTEFKPRAEWPDLAPLYLMDRDFTNGQVDDFLLGTTTADLEYAHSLGYKIRNIQGYVFKPCSPEPACIPPSAQKLWRACKSADGDCAIFLESERVNFELNGYTAAFPPGTAKRIGYAYPAIDTDHDGLPDGFEHVVGTSPTRSNSDNDGWPDAVEFPLAGVPGNDPCGGPGSVGALYCTANVIFRNGFDLL